jgi:hypothetical protein
VARQGYRLHLTNIEASTWRPTFSHDAMSAAEGFAAASTPWAAVRRAAFDALLGRHEPDTEGGGGGQRQRSAVDWSE